MDSDEKFYTTYIERAEWIRTLKSQLGKLTHQDDWNLGRRAEWSRPKKIVLCCFVELYLYIYTHMYIYTYLCIPVNYVSNFNNPYFFYLAFIFTTSDGSWGRRIYIGKFIGFTTSTGHLENVSNFIGSYLLKVILSLSYDKVGGQPFANKRLFSLIYIQDVFWWTWKYNF